MSFVLKRERDTGSSLIEVSSHRYTGCIIQRIISTSSSAANIDVPDDKILVADGRGITGRANESPQQAMPRSDFYANYRDLSSASERCIKRVAHSMRACGTRTRCRDTRVNRKISATRLSVNRTLQVNYYYTQTPGK